MDSSHQSRALSEPQYRHIRLPGLLNQKKWSSCHQRQIRKCSGHTLCFLSSVALDHYLLLIAPCSCLAGCLHPLVSSCSPCPHLIIPPSWPLSLLCGSVTVLIDSYWLDSPPGSVSINFEFELILPIAASAIELDLDLDLVRLLLTLRSRLLPRSSRELLLLLLAEGVLLLLFLPDALNSSNQ